MAATPLSNVAVQMVAAFLIFVTGFAALFAVLVVCSGAIWILWRCVERLAVLMPNSGRSRSVLETQEVIATPAAPNLTIGSRDFGVATPRR